MEELFYNLRMQRTLTKIQNFNVDTFTFEQALEHAVETCGQVITINPEMIAYASSNPEFAKIINEAELVIPDGIGVQIGLKILGVDVRRIAGIEFARKMLDITALNGKKVALIGAKPQIIKDAVENLQKEILNINIVYSHDGYFQNDDEIIAQLAQLKPDLVLTALGSPRQEEFNYKAKTLMPEALFVGVGGSFDVWAGAVQRAPEIYQKLGLEWLYRTVKEPQRFKRIFPTLPLFILKIFKEKLIGV